MTDVYVVCKNNCMYPAMTKEEIIAAITEATGNTPTMVGDAFINQIVNQNTGGNLKFWRGVWAEYNALAEKDPETYYIITDKPSGVSSVFGRTGDVVAQYGDYSAEDVGAVPVSGGSMGGALTAGGEQSEANAEVRNVVILASGTSDFSAVPNNTIILVKE